MCLVFVCDSGQNRYRATVRLSSASLIYTPKPNSWLRPYATVKTYYCSNQTHGPKHAENTMVFWDNKGTNTTISKKATNNTAGLPVICVLIVVAWTSEAGVVVTTCTAENFAIMFSSGLSFVLVALAVHEVRTLQTDKIYYYLKSWQLSAKRSTSL